MIKHLGEILNAFIMYKCRNFLRNIVRKALAVCKGRYGSRQSKLL